MIALGSNIGDRLLNLQKAVDLLRVEIQLARPSSVYETAPMYLEDQPEFLNAAIEGFTELGPVPLLRILKRIEADIGRQSRRVNGPREVDLDLILYAGLKYRYEEGGRVVLQIPHPKLSERRFVLAPMADVGENVNIPGIGRVLDLLAKTNEQAESVVRITDAVLHI